MEIILVLRALTNKCKPKCKRCRTPSKIYLTRSATFKICSMKIWLPWKTKSKNRTTLSNRTWWILLWPRNNLRNWKINAKPWKVKLKFLQVYLNTTNLAITKKSANNCKTTSWYPNKKVLNLSKKFKIKMRNGTKCTSLFPKTFATESRPRILNDPWWKSNP